MKPQDQHFGDFHGPPWTEEALRALIRMEPNAQIKEIAERELARRDAVNQKPKTKQETV
jgi:hypothetical protein